MSENNNRRQKQKIIAFKESLEVVNRQKNTATQKTRGKIETRNVFDNFALLSKSLKSSKKS